MSTIAVKNTVRIVPPIIITEAEIDDVLGRMVAAIRRAQDGYPRHIDFRNSSSLAIGQASASEHLMSRRPADHARIRRSGWSERSRSAAARATW